MARKLTLDWPGDVAWCPVMAAVWCCPPTSCSKAPGSKRAVPHWPSQLSLHQGPLSHIQLLKGTRLPRAAGRPLTPNATCFTLLSLFPECTCPGLNTTPFDRPGL